MFLQDFFSHYFWFLTCIFNLQRLLAIEALRKGVPNDNSLILNINQEISIYHMTSQNPLTSRIKSFLRFCFPNEKKTVCKMSMLTKWLSMVRYHSDTGLYKSCHCYFRLCIHVLVCVNYKQSGLYKYTLLICVLVTL